MNTVHGSHEDRVGLLVLRIPALIITIYTEFGGALEKLAALHLALTDIFAQCSHFSAAASLFSSFLN